VQLRLPIPEQAFSNSPLSPLGWWEIDHYVGVLGLAFILVYGVLIPWLDRPPETRSRVLAAPILAMTVLSIGRLFEPINALGIPLISSQRVSTRFMILPLLFLLVLAGSKLQRRLERSGASLGAQALGLALLAVGAQDLWQHIKLWRYERMFGLFADLPVDLSGEVVANHSDPAYTLALGIGWGVALLTLVALVYAAVRESRSTMAGASGSGSGRPPAASAAQPAQTGVTTSMKNPGRKARSKSRRRMPRKSADGANDRA
jgi:hypothetical protein